MNKRGFTLIELLAVIIILAVIAIITIPMILNVVEDSRKSAYKDSVLSAFNAVEYYVVDNNLGDVPASGIEVKNLNLKNNNFKSGKIIKNVDGILTAEFISDGEYCATGTLTNLNISKGECEIDVPGIEVVVTSKTATITISDTYGIIAYAITESSDEPTSWTEVEETTGITEEVTADHASTYYVHVKNKYGKVNTKEYVIEGSAFCAYKPGDVIKEFSYTGNTEEFEVPCSGVYKLEVYGSKGGDTTSSYRWTYTGYNAGTGSKTGTGANGTYVYGYTDLVYHDKLYFNVGGLEYNGGGKSTTGGYTAAASLTDCKTAINVTGGSGGGATDIRINNNELENRIIVAGGGGGGIAQGSAWAYHYQGSTTGTTNTNQSLSSANANETVSINGTLSLGTDAVYSGGRITGAGGGGYYGGEGSYLGSSYIDMNRFFNYDSSTNTKTSIVYSGTNGQNDFISAK